MEESKFQKTVVAGFKELEKLFNKKTILKSEVKNVWEYNPMHEQSAVTWDDLYNIFETYWLPFEMAIEELRNFSKEKDIPINEDFIREDFEKSENSTPRSFTHSFCWYVQGWTRRS
jgi:alanyl-tRNA synthetase